MLGGMQFGVLAEVLFCQIDGRVQGRFRHHHDAVLFLLLYYGVVNMTMLPPASS